MVDSIHILPVCKSNAAKNLEPGFLFTSNLVINIYLENYCELFKLKKKNVIQDVCLDMAKKIFLAGLIPGIM